MLKKQHTIMGPVAHAINDTPGRRGPYKPNMPRVPGRADSQQLSSLIPKPWMAVAARGTIEWTGCGQKESAGFDGSFSADSKAGSLMIRVIVSMIRDRQR